MVFNYLSMDNLDEAFIFYDFELYSIVDNNKYGYAATDTD